MATTSIITAITHEMNEHLFLELEQYEPAFARFAHIKQMDGPFVDVQQYEGYPPPQRRLPGEPVFMAGARESFRYRFTPAFYALGDAIPNEFLREDPFGLLHRIIPQRGTLAGAAFQVISELEFANWFNLYAFLPGTSIPNATSLAATLTPDGLPLFHPAHPVSLYNTQQTYASAFAVPMDLSVASYNLARQILVQQPYPDGYIIKPNRPRCLVINPSLHTVARQLIQQPYEPNSADRNMNVVVGDNVEIVEWPYFRVSGLVGGSYNPPAWNGWMLFGEEHHVDFYWKNDAEFEADSDIHTRSTIFVGHIAFGFGAADARGVFGSPGL
jgi:hypothetical protein